MNKDENKCFRCLGNGYITCPGCEGMDESIMDEGYNDNRIVSCATCHGRGQVTCGICNGTGKNN